ncbi:RNA-directed DNA polymerase, partial [Lactobacillus selangorensis]
MKRYGNLIHDIADPETIKLALHQAAIGKRHRKSVSRRLNHEEETIQQIQYLLLSGAFKPAKVKTWTTHERDKDRQITTTPFFPDQIIHWSIMLVLQPIFLKSMYEYNLATVPGRGMAQGRKVIPKWLQNDPKRTKYCLKMDIHHFYASINTDILKLKLQHRFKDPQVLRLLGVIIDSYSPGLPLGLYTSQWLANFYLEDFDHKVKND